MNDTLKKMLSFGIGAAVMSKEKIEKYVDELVSKGEVPPGDSQDLVNRLIAKGEEQQTEIKRVVREQLQQILAELDVATKQELSMLEQRVQSLEQQPVQETN